MITLMELGLYACYLLGGLVALAVIPPVRRAVYQKPWLTILIKNLYTFVGKPYFKVSVFHHKEIGLVGVDAQYNIHFLYLLDSAYDAAGVEYYNRGLSEEAKVAIYLYDTMGSIADNYMPMPSGLQEIMDDDDIPPMRMQDEADTIRQVVDLGRAGGGNGLDIATG